MFKNKSPALPFNRLNTNILNRAKYKNSANITAENTRRNLKNIATCFNQYLQDNKKTISPETIALFLADLKLEQSPATWNLSRQNLKTVLKLQPKINSSYPLKMLVEEIFRDIKPFNIDHKVRDFLTGKQVEKLAEGSSIRLGLMIRFLFYTGCRISEMINIRLQDIRSREITTISIVSKGNKQRTIFLPSNLYEAIRREFCGVVWLFETGKGNKYNRSTIWRQLKRSGREVLGKEIHPHMLRHSTANFLLDKGRSAKYVSEYLHHSSPAITLEMYIHEQIQPDDVKTLFA